MIDVQEAKRFLSALSSHDDGTIFSFQTLYDTKAEHDAETREAEEKRLTRVIHGRFDDVVQELIEMNRKGAGVFVCVNRTNGMGLRGKDIDRIRSFFIDDDTDHIEATHLDLAPSIVVRSKRGKHFYWLMSNGTAKDTFGPAQKALADKFETDKTISNLNRVMRIPGFLHNKGEPYPVRLEHADPNTAYELSDVAGAFDLDIEQYVYTPRTNVDTDDIAAIPMDRRIQRARGMLHAIGPAVRNSGDGHSKTLAACRVGNDFAVEDFTFLGLLQEWGSACEPPWDPGQLETFYLSTLGSINTNKWPRGGKLLDDTYASKRPSRPEGASAASLYRGNSVPWSDDAAHEPETSFDGSPDGRQPVEHREGPRPPAPIAGAKPTATRRVVGRATPPKSESTSADGLKISPALTYEEIFADSPRPQRKKRPEEQGYRVGALIEDCEGDVAHGDDDRSFRDMAHMLNEEYEIRRTDNRSVYIYASNFWQETSKEFIEKLALQYTTYGKATPKKLGDAAKMALTKKHVRSIHWNKVAPTDIPLKNGVLNMVTGEIREHRASDYIDRIIPIEYTPGATCDLWLKCLDEWLPDMDIEQEALQHFFGYLLMPHARYKKALILYGGPDTGKSQVCSVAIALVGGIDNTCAITPDQMDDASKLASIKGKALNCVADLPKNTMLADGGFKQLVSSGDAVQMNQKYTREEMYTPTAKHIFATNNLPTIRDVTDAVYRRLMILAFDNRVPLDKQDAMLESKLREELPGILNWAIEGAKKLYENKGRWPLIPSSEALTKEYKLEQNALYFYVKESGDVMEDQNGRVKTEELRNKMNDFNGGRTNYGRRGFSKLIDGLSTDLPDLQRKKRSGASWVYGLRWSTGQETLAIDD